MGDPLVSIIIPVFNRAELVVETLDSVSVQTYSHWEAIVVDDRSTDGTGEAVREVAEADSRVRLIVRPEGGRGGAPRCRNLGVQHSRGELVMFLDSDDLLGPECLGKRVRILQERPDLDCVIVQGKKFRTHPGDMDRVWSGITDDDTLARFVRRDTVWQTAGPLWRRPFLDRLGEWDENLIASQDTDFHFRALLLGMRYEWRPQADYYIRHGDGDRESISGPDRGLAIWENQRYRTRKMLCLLREHAQLSAVRRTYVVADALHVANGLEGTKGGRGKGTALWKEYRAEGVVAGGLYRAGLIYLRVRPRYLKGLVSWALYRAWPQHMRAMYNRRTEPLVRELDEHGRWRDPKARDVRPEVLETGLLAYTRRSVMRLVRKMARKGRSLYSTLCVGVER